MLCVTIWKCGIRPPYNELTYLDTNRLEIPTTRALTVNTSASGKKEIAGEGRVERQLKEKIDFN